MLRTYSLSLSFCDNRVGKRVHHTAFESENEILSSASVEQYSPVVVFVMLYKVSSVEILKCEHANGSY